MVKCLPEFEYFYCVLEKKNIIFKIRRSKVTDYAALSLKLPLKHQFENVVCYTYFLTLSTDVGVYA